MTTSPLPNPPSYPLEITRSITFIASSKEDEDYLAFDSPDFLVDLKSFSTDIGLEIKSVL